MHLHTVTSVKQIRYPNVSVISISYSQTQNDSFGVVLIGRNVFFLHYSQL